MASLKIYSINPLIAEDVLNIKGYSKINETEEINNIDLKQKIENFKQNDNLFSFTFKHETVDKVEIGDEILPNFHVYFGDVWIQIKENKSYMFISSPGNEEFISDVIKNILQSKIKNLEKEIIIEKVDLKDCFADIIAIDAIKVSGSWFKKINPQDQSAYLNGTLIDEEGRESVLYSKLKDSAKQQSSITITSRKLVKNISFSECKISSRNKEVTNISLIDYFDKIIYSFISQ